MAIDVEAKAIAVFSYSGTTCRMISRFRPPMPILGLTPNEKISRRLAMSWGVVPVVVNEYDDRDKMFAEGMKTAKRVFSLKQGDPVVLTGGKLRQ